MANRVSMPLQDAEERSHNFEEVALGYTLEMAQEEAKRCLNCKKPFCVEGCPVQVNIPAFIMKIKEGDIDGAYETIINTNRLPAVCGRVCPQEEQCEKVCILTRKGESVAIGRLERFAADRAKPEKVISNIKNGAKKVAVVGSGPAGLTAAGELASLGYDVTIFEALHKAGGVLVYGIPEFRLPKDIVRREIASLEDMGVKIVCNAVIGKSITIDELLEQGFEAVFIGSGAGLPQFMQIPGEHYNGVYSANEYLTRINLMAAWKNDGKTPIKRVKRAAVIGGGNVAMDAARSALRLGADEVVVVYRRTEAEMPARKEEIEHAHEEGIHFEFLSAPLEIRGENGFVTGMLCQRMQLGEPDSSGRRSVTPIENSQYMLDVDQVIVAIGTRPNPLIASTTPGLETNKWGCVVVHEESMKTSRDGVYAGGDVVTGAATVILAMGAGRTAAAAIHEQLSK